MDSLLSQVSVEVISGVALAILGLLGGYILSIVKDIKEMTKKYKEDRAKLEDKIKELEDDIKRLKEFSHVTKLGLESWFLFANHEIKNGKLDNAIKEINNFRL